MFRIYRKASDNMKEIFDVGFFTGLFTYIFVQAFTRNFSPGLFIVPLTVFIVLYVPVLFKAKNRSTVEYIVKTPIYLIESFLLYLILQSFFEYSYRTNAFEMILFIGFTIILIGFGIGIVMKIAVYLLGKLPGELRYIRVIPVLLLALFCIVSWFTTIAGVISFFLPNEGEGFEQLGTLFMMIISFFVSVITTVGLGFTLQKFEMSKKVIK